MVFPSKLELAIVFCTMLATTLLFYGAVFDNFFTTDDFFSLGYFHDANGFAFNALPKIYNDGFSRLTTATFNAAIFQIAGYTVFPYRAFSVLLHSINAFLVFLFVFLLTKNKKLAFFSALVFVAFYLNAEAVCWFSAIGDLLSAFFVLLCLIYFILFLEKQKRLFLALCFVFFTLAIFSKESVFFFGIVLLLFELLFFPPKKPNSKFFSKYLVFFLVTLLYFLLRPTNSPTAHPIGQTSLVLSYLFSSFLVAFFPFELLGNYHFKFLENLFLNSTFLFFFLSAFFFLVFLLIKKKQKLAIFCLFWFFCFILVAVIFAGISMRYFYVSSIGASIFLCSVGYSIAKRAIAFFGKKQKEAIIVLFLLLFLLFFFVSFSFVTTHEKGEDIVGKVTKAYIFDANHFHSLYPEKKIVFFNSLFILGSFSLRLPGVVVEDDIFYPFDVNIGNYFGNRNTPNFYFLDSASLQKELDSNSLVLFFDYNSMHLRRIISFSLEKNLIVASEKKLSGKKDSLVSFGQKIVLNDSNTRSTFLFSSTVDSTSKDFSSEVFFCPPSFESACDLDNPWSTFSVYLAKDSSSRFVEVPEYYSTVIVAFRVFGEGKATYRASLQKVNFVFGPQEN